MDFHGMLSLMRCKYVGDSRQKYAGGRFQPSTCTTYHTVSRIPINHPKCVREKLWRHLKPPDKLSIPRGEARPTSIWPQTAQHFRDVLRLLNALVITINRYHSTIVSTTWSLTNSARKRHCKSQCISMEIHGTDILGYHALTHVEHATYVDPGASNV